MKKSILIIATALLSFLQINASNDYPSNSDSNIKASPLVQIFEWHVLTKHGKYSGTSANVTHASNMITLVSTGEVMVEKKIESYYMLEVDFNANAERIYLWEVTSTNGHAQGYSSSENAARKMIDLVVSGDIITSKIIKSGLTK